MNEATDSMIREIFRDDLVAMDEKTALVNRNEFQQKLMKEIANTAEQPATLELNGEGDIKTMSDGTRYRVTPDGWRKL
jgi:hypothetical protein